MWKNFSGICGEKKPTIVEELFRKMWNVEEEYIPLKERVRRANKLSCQIGHPIQETIIISIHVIAAGNGLRPFFINQKE